MHEVGHTLGLRHNFVASASPMHSYDQLGNRTHVLEHGVAASVMDYNAINLRSREQRTKDEAAGRRARGDPRSDVLFMHKVGAYDVSAIQYGYGNPLPTAAAAAHAAAIATAGTGTGTDAAGADAYAAEAAMATISGDPAPITTTTSTAAAAGGGGGGSSAGAKNHALYTRNGQVAPVASSAFHARTSSNANANTNTDADADADAHADADAAYARAALAAVAASAPPFATDEDVSDANPYAQRHDLAQEPYEYHTDRLQLVREIRQQMMMTLAGKDNSTAGTTSTSGTSSGTSSSGISSGSSGGSISQLVVRDGESWERWWAMERVLLGTIRNSGQRMAQYIGGHRVSKQHRNSGSSSSSGIGSSSGSGSGSIGRDVALDVAPVTNVGWQKQRQVLATILTDILPMPMPMPVPMPMLPANTTASAPASAPASSPPLYPPAWQYPYMVTRARPDWCQGHGSLYDYCYGQKPVKVAAVVASVRAQVLAAVYGRERLARVDAQQQMQQMQQMQQQMEVEDGDALSVMELLDMGTDTLMTTTATSTNSSSSDTTTSSTSTSSQATSSSSQASWSLEGSWVRLVASLAASTDEGVKAGAFGALLGMQDSMTQTLDALTAALSGGSSSSSGSSGSRSSRSVRRARGHVKGQLVAVTRVLDGRAGD
jgi:hypothetical protein